MLENDCSRNPATVVNSWNEWDPLRHVIIGRADGSQIPFPEPGFDCRVFENPEFRSNAGPRSQEAVERANAQLDGFADLLRSRGIVVDRPTPIDFSKSVRTPDFDVENMFGCMPPRDILVTIGSEILEATMSYRSRWFEYLCYRPLLQRYFREDRAMKWEAAPKPRLTERSFRSNYLTPDTPRSERLRRVQDRVFVTTEEEPLFDAADIVRLGRDLIVQHGFTTNLAGIDWLRRHLPTHRVHVMHFPGDPAPIHIDCTLLPLRPGLVLSNPDRPLLPSERALFDDNGWQIISAAPPAHRTPPPLCYSSVWLSMNVLVLDPKTVCVEASEHAQIEQLAAHGFDVVPVPFRDAYPFGGGLHCATADVFREGTCDDYFPNQ